MSSDFLNLHLCLVLFRLLPATHATCAAVLCCSVFVLQALSSRDMTTFLLRAPPSLFSSCTQAQALKVLAFLKRDLGVKQEYLFPRIVCAAPAVLLQVSQAGCGSRAAQWGLYQQGRCTAGQHSM